jgi:hypothetical protein
VSGTTQLALIAVDQVDQHPCLTPADGSYTLVDVGVLDLAGGREAIVYGVERTGGMLCALNANTAAASAVCFLPRKCFVDAGAACLVRALFPEVNPVASLVVVLEGEFRIDVPALAWRPLSIATGEAGVEGGAQARTVAELLARRWHDDEDELSGVASEVAGCCSLGSIAKAPGPSGLHTDAEGWIDPRAR